MRKRTKKVLIVLAALPFVLFAVAVVWVAVNSRDIPVPDTSDLAIETVRVSDENNAYVYFNTALDSFYWPEQEAGQVDSILDGRTWDDEFVSGLISKNSDTIGMIKRGLACPIYLKLEESKSDSINPHWKWLNPAKLMALKAMYERRTMQSEQALESCLDLLRFGTLVIARPRSVIEYALGLYILDLALQECRELLVESRFTEAELVSLSDKIDRVGSLDQGLVRAVKIEFELISGRISDFDTELRRVGSIKRPILYHAFRRYSFQPNRTKRAFAVFCRTMMQNASRTYADRALPKDDPAFASGQSGFIQILRPNGFSKMLMPEPNYLNRFFKGKCKIQAHLAGMRLVVACRVYEMRHGQLPDTLESLVPVFLDLVPCDPYDGKPFRYLPKQAIVYSVGVDIKDSGVSRKPVEDETMTRNTKRDENTEDLVYDIHANLEHAAPVDVP